MHLVTFLSIYNSLPLALFFHAIYLLKKLGHLFCRIFHVPCFWMILSLWYCFIYFSTLCISCKLFDLDVVLSSTAFCTERNVLYLCFLIW